ncbi:MAG: hypothetical protein E6Q67_05810 [Roseateles sp.]|nr:MAG: hypothetical protein E6Q67_05810 [Roseateles sp.]
MDASHSRLNRQGESPFVVSDVLVSFSFAGLAMGVPKNSRANKELSMTSMLDAARVKALAKELQRSSSAIGITLPQATFYEALAHEHQFKDWNSFKAHLDRKGENSDQRLQVAYAMLTWRGGEVMHSLDASGRYDAPTLLAQRVQKKSRFSLEGLAPRFTRIDRQGLPRPPRPPQLITWTKADPSSDAGERSYSVRDAWPAELSMTPQLGDCTPFRVDFRSDREEAPVASALVWFLTSYQDSDGVRWSFGQSGVFTVSPIYRFLESLRQAPVERRSVVTSEMHDGQPRLMKFVEDQSTPQRHSVPATAATPEAAAEINKQANVSHMDELDIMRAFKDQEAIDCDAGDDYS